MEASDATGSAATAGDGNRGRMRTPQHCFLSNLNMGAEEPVRRFF